MSPVRLEVYLITSILLLMLKLSKSFIFRCVDRYIGRQITFIAEFISTTLLGIYIYDICKLLNILLQILMLQKGKDTAFALFSSRPCYNFCILIFYSITVGSGFKVV